MSYRTAKGLLEALKTVDGEGSGLDADLLRGLSPNKFVRTDVPSTIQVDNHYYPLVISGTPNPDNPLDSIGLALYPDKDKDKRVEYSSTRGGEFRIYCARYLTNVLYSDNGNLKFLGHKVWHQGDVAQLLSSSGYIKFPNGLIIQWGRGGTTSDSNGIASFTFPIAFPNACFQVVPVDVGDACYDYGIGDGQINTTGFSCYVRYSNGSIAADTPVGIRYIAVGY